MCVGNLTIVGSDNGLSPGRRQAIIWTNIANWTFKKQILVEIFPFTKMHLKVSSALWRSFCLGINVLICYTSTNFFIYYDYYIAPKTVRNVICQKWGRNRGTIFSKDFRIDGCGNRINSLWPDDVIWWHISGSTLAQVMAFCLTAPSHYLNQCWHIINKVQWHPSECNFTRDISAISHWN